ncbi:hypothetical protein [Kitasatospora sp. NBC_01266]|uniref:hypothetical protein n=1 Tax=Kitasatospora sp. NBC_01266 TaxID=2903572 RepID=UPI002E303097|nr:hypothetical protein [Kitasatospora sp. NBC_01266]
MSLAEPPPHPGLTIQIYRITRTGERIDLGSAEYGPELPSSRSLLVDTWPVCQCPRCVRSLSDPAPEGRGMTYVPPGPNR